MFRRCGIKHKIDISVIRSINEKINSRMSLGDLLVSIMDAAKELLDAEGCSLLLDDPKTDDLIFDVVVGEKGDIIRGERIPVGKGIAGIAAVKREPVIVDDAQNDPRWYHDIDQKYQFHTRNILCIPMLVRGDFVGVLEMVNSTGRERFDDRDLELGRYIAGQAAIAINNRRLYDDLANRIEEMTALYEVAQAISMSGPDEDIIGIICSSLARSMKVRRVSIMMYDEQEGRLKIESAYGLPDFVQSRSDVDVHPSIADHVFTTGDPMMVVDIKSEIPKGLQSNNSDYKTDSFISVPIRFKNSIIGVLSCADKINGATFDSFDLRIIMTLSSEVSQVYNNLLAQWEAEKQRRLAREIDIAAEIQRKIMRDIPRTFGSHQLAAFNQPAKMVGGDFYDFFQLDNNKYSIAIADISGKGIPAALFMGLAMNIVRAERRVNSSPATLLRNANKYIHQDSEHGMFVTMFYAVIDSHNKLITYASGGHNDQLLVRFGTGECMLLNAEGRALGLAADQHFEERVVHFESGDMLLLFTDGVTECFGGDRMDIESGQRKMGEIALRHIAAGPASMIEYYKQHYFKTGTNVELVDDVTIVGIKF